MWAWLKTNHQVLTAIGAMFVGAAALFIAWDQARVMRAQQHGAVVPALQIDGFSARAPDRFSLGLRVVNAGVGPAIIEGVSARRNGEPQTDLAPLFAALPVQPGDRSWGSLVGRIVGAGDYVEPMLLSWDTNVIDAAALEGIAAEVERWDIRVCYCSVFERCWEASNAETARPSPVRQCGAPADDIFVMGVNDLALEAAGELRPEPAAGPQDESQG